VSHSNSELWHLLFDLQILVNGHCDVTTTPEYDDAVEAFDPEHDERYRAAMLKAREACPATIDDEEGDWSLL